MRDPMTVAHDIKYPWWKYRPWPRRVLDAAASRYSSLKDEWEGMEPSEKRGRSPIWEKGYRESFITIWHNDPERDGTDDSCGFCVPKLSREHRERLKALAWNEARDPYFLRQSGKVWAGSQAEAEAMWRGLVLLICKYAHVKMTFDEAATIASLTIHSPESCPAADRLCFQPSYHTNSKTDSREERQEYFYGMCCNLLAWILKDRRPWYRHPRWHIWHWRIQCHPWQSLRRGLFDRCEVCGKGFPIAATVVSTCWDRPRPTGLARLAFWRSTTHIRHDNCQSPATCVEKEVATTKGTP